MQQPIIVSYIQGNSVLPLPNEDHISCLIFLGQLLPSGFTANVDGFSDLHLYKSIQQVEADGITEGNAFTALMWYHCDAFFRKAPNAHLYVMISGTPASNNYITYVQTQTNGKIRQVGVHSNELYDIPQTYEDIHTQTGGLAAVNMPLFVVYECDMYGYTDPAIDAGALNYPYLAFCVAQDGANEGNDMFTVFGQSIGCIGLVLGCMAAAKVNESIGWVAKFNASRGNGLEFDEPAIADGTLVKNNVAMFDDFEQTRHLVLTKYTGSDGTYFRTDANCTYPQATDLHSISRVRTVNKVWRLVTAALLPSVNGPLLKNPTTGNLSDSTIAYLEETAYTAIKVNMINYSELSGASVTIDPVLGFDNNTQKSVVNVAINLVDVATAEQFNVSLSYVTNI
jgi:hypothetical protein